MLAELLLERRRPGHELEAEAVVDHREATGREGETLAIHACDMLACGRLQIRQARVGREPRRGGIQPATAQGTQEIALKDDALRSEEHTSELQSLMRIAYAVFCLKKKIIKKHSVYRTQPNT